MRLRHNGGLRFICDFRTSLGPCIKHIDFEPGEVDDLTPAQLADVFWVERWALVRRHEGRPLPLALHCCPGCRDHGSHHSTSQIKGALRRA